MNQTRALILGGGGPAATAWETGVIAGLAGGNVNLATADLVVGTSGGAVVAAQITSGVPMSVLFERQVDPGKQVQEEKPAMTLDEVVQEMYAIQRASTSALDMRRRFGAFALTMDRAPKMRTAGFKRAVVAQRLLVHHWPDQRLVIVAVDANSGEPSFFDRGSGVELIDAVTASCAAPGAWPTHPIGTRHFVDGGLRSNDNADVAVGFKKVFILSPHGGTIDMPSEWEMDLASALQ